jgi:hypothetical protein
MLPTLPHIRRKLKPRRPTRVAPSIGRGHARAGFGNWYATPKCPACGWPLIARMGRRRPYLHCRCTARREEA